NNNIWNLPASVTIPPSGLITVTATCAAIGAVSAPAGTITTINTPTRGWQSVTNPADAVPGAEVESDAALRSRQKIST
ncbi:baseplate J/gp47 family protein, partial [Salmonella enterica]|uniref:baseplate J/gp47 family protein n=1 Tax=Salmonella enterica TaxID=28901 RepID=UPI003CF64EC4